MDVCNDLGCAQVLLSEDGLANTFSFLFRLMPRVVKVYSCSQGLVISKVAPRYAMSNVSSIIRLPPAPLWHKLDVRRSSLLFDERYTQHTSRDLSTTEVIDWRGVLLERACCIIRAAGH